MSVFQDTEELDEVMVNLWQEICADEKIFKQLIASKLIVQFNYSQPSGILNLDCSDGENCHISVGSTSLKPVIKMSMKADMAHEFWMGRVNVPIALLSGKIVSQGPTARALSLLPIIKSAFPLYTKILKRMNKEKLLSK